MNSLTALTSTADVSDFFTKNNSTDGSSIFTNMVMSLNGGYSQNRTSASLGSELDRQMLIEIRNTADVILVGAETIRAERYFVPTNKSGTTIPLATVTTTGDLGALSQAHQKEVISYQTGDDNFANSSDQIDLNTVIDDLKKRGFKRILCEGGPALLEQLNNTGLIETHYRTYSPYLTSDAQWSLNTEPIVTNLELRYCARSQSGELFARWDSAS